MTDRVFPASKPNGTAQTNGHAATNTTANPRLPPPPTKNQLYNPNLTRYRQNPTTHRRNTRRRCRCRRCFCLCCFWSILVIILLLLMAAIAGCVLYLLYRPHRPTFSISSLRISQFNLTTAADDTTHLTSKLNLTLSTKNPNKKLIYYYDPISISCLSGDTQIANGSFPNPFISNPNNITVIRSSLYSNSLLLETETVNQIRSDLKKKAGLPLKIVLETEARVKIESLRSKRVGIRIKCQGIRTQIPKSNVAGGKSNASTTAVAATVSDAKCKVDLRIKIWKWTF